MVILILLAPPGHMALLMETKSFFQLLHQNLPSREMEKIYLLHSKR
jgi:hypothetical protein